MNCQILFSGKNKKNICCNCHPKCSALNVSVNDFTCVTSAAGEELTKNWKILIGQTATIILPIHKLFPVINNT